MTQRTFIAAYLAALSLSAAASDYYVVLPVKGKTENVSAIQVALNQGTLPAGQVGGAYSYDFKQNLQVTGDPKYAGSGAAWTLSSGTLPAGLSLDAKTGVVSGTPTAGGTSTFSLTATYKTKTGSQGYQVVVGNITVALASATLADAAVGSAYSYNFLPLLTVTGDAAYSSSGVTWSVASGAVPAGLTLNADGTLTGSPSAAGTSTFTLNAAYKSKQSQQSYSLATAAGFSVIQLAGYQMAARVGAIYDYSQAVALCAGTINGKSDWRLPTQTEFESLRPTFGYAAGFTAQGWPSNSTSDYYWTSTAYSTGHVVRFAQAGGSWGYSYQTFYAACVRTDAATAGLVALLEAEGANGSSSFYDGGAAHTTITPVGTAVVTTSKFTQGSSSLDLTGGGYLQYANNASHDLVANQSFTIEADIQPVSLANGKMIANKRTVNGSPGWNMGVNAAGQLLFWYYDGSFSAVATSAAGSVVANTWTKVAVSREGSTVRLYINGVRSGTPLTLGGATSTATGMRIGTDELGGGRFGGYIDNFQFTQGVAKYTN